MSTPNAWTRTRIKITASLEKHYNPTKFPVIYNSSSAVSLFRPLAGGTRTSCAVAALDMDNRVLGTSVVAHGIAAAEHMFPRDVFEFALHCTATSVIVAVVRPTADCTPTPVDWDAASRMRSVGDLMGIRVVNWLIFGATGHATRLADDQRWERDHVPPQA